MDLLFVMAHWHALAKLQQHTDLSLAILESVTIQLGKSLRKFQVQTCAVYDTRELRHKEAARMRRAAKKSLASGPRSAGEGDTTNSQPPKSTMTVTITAGPSSTASTLQKALSKTKAKIGKQQKTLNLKTYKDHSLGDYVETIRRYGTTDSYSTESVSLLQIVLFLTVQVDS